MLWAIGPISLEGPLLPVGEAARQSLGQAALTHLGLGGGEIIGQTKNLKSPCLGIPESAGGALVAVPGLADGAGIVGRRRPLLADDGLAIFDENGFDAAGGLAQAQRHMAVAAEDRPDAHKRGVALDMLRAQEILVRGPPRRAVDQGEPRSLKAGAQAGQKTSGLRAQGGHCPSHGRARVGIEPLHVEAAEHGQVVIATDGVEPAELAQGLHALVGIRAVANEVPAAEVGLDPGGMKKIQDDFQGFQVGMDVREDTAEHTGR